MEINHQHSKKDIIRIITNDIFLFWKQYDIILSNGNEYPNSTIKTKENENGITGIERITEAD